MSQSSLLSRVSHRIISFLDQRVFEVDPDYNDEIVSAMYSLHKIFPQWLIMTCPVQHNSFFYVSNNCSDIIGHMSEQLQRLRPEGLIELIHHADMAHLQTCFSYCESIVKNEPKGHQHIRCTFNYRLQHANGHYLHMHDEKAAFLLSNGSMVYFCMMRDITHEKPFAGVRVEVFKQNGTTTTKLGECHPARTEQKLSPREQDLIVLIRQGLTTKEIAHHLHISHNTVRNIRSKMFEKYQVNNVVELLNRTMSFNPKSLVEH
jgi:DNA-binding CsgD family transcriptional regulator